MNGIWIDILELLAVAGLILANAFFVAAEFALVSVRRTRIEELSARGNTTAMLVRHLIRDPDRFIAATQLGITIASLGLGWIGEPALAHLIEPVFGILLGTWAAPGTRIIIAGAIAFALITFLHVVVGELAPKSLALGYPETTALVVSRPTYLFENIFRPAIWALNGAGNALLGLLGLRRPAGHQLVHSVEELKMLVTESQRAGEIEPSERIMIHNVFEFADREVYEVMIPRTDIVAVEDTATVDDFLKDFARTAHERYPIYSGNLDNIIGYLSIKDILSALTQDGAARTRPIREFLRTALYVPESKRVSELLSEMQKSNKQLAIVLDEYGGTAGMATTENLLEEIVGGIGDERATPPPIRKIDENTADVQAQLRVDEVNEYLGTRLPESDDYETLAGLILTRMGRIPQVGDSVQVGGVKLTVAQMGGPRIENVILTKPAPPSGTPHDGLGPPPSSGKDAKT